MSQCGTVFVGHSVVQVQFPSAKMEVLPGIRWGAIEAFPTPAYWAYQVVARRIVGGPPKHRLGRSLAEEVVACVLGGHGIPAETGLAAFRSLRSTGLLGGTPTAAALLRILEQPMVVGGRTVHYRFASRKAKYVAKALQALDGVDPPQSSGRELRDWLLHLDGVGYKTASWIARNWMDADDVAILDIHVLRAGSLGGFLNNNLTVERNYLQLENEFLNFADALGVRAAELDAVIWQEMSLSSRTVRRLLAAPCEC